MLLPSYYHSFTYTNGSSWLDIHASCDGGHGGGNGAREASRIQNVAEVNTIGVDDAAEVFAGNGKAGRGGDGVGQGTGHSCANLLANAHIIGGKGQTGDGHLRGTCGAVGERGRRNRLSIGDSDGDEGSDGSEELHGCLMVVWIVKAGVVDCWRAVVGKKETFRYQARSFYTEMRTKSLMTFS